MEGIVKENVKGAPFNIKDEVIVLNNPQGDEAFDERYVGLKGEIIAFDYNKTVGQTYPDDPLIVVSFDEEVRPDTNTEFESFWKEELQKEK